MSPVRITGTPPAFTEALPPLTVAEACGGTPDLIARRYRRYTEVISVALQVALYNSHRRFLAVCIKAPVIGG